MRNWVHMFVPVSLHQMLKMVCHHNIVAKNALSGIVMTYPVMDPSDA